LLLASNGRRDAWFLLNGREGCGEAYLDASVESASSRQAL
jgi:hypothetical protein